MNTKTGGKFDAFSEDKSQISLLPESEKVMLIAQIDHYLKHRSDRMDFMMLVGEQEQFELL